MSNDDFLNGIQLIKDALSGCGTVVSLEIWDGVILKVLDDDGVFITRLGTEDEKMYYAEISFNEVSEKDKILIEEGTSLKMVRGYIDTSSGLRRKSSIIFFGEKKE